MKGLNYAKESLDPARLLCFLEATSTRLSFYSRLRNHDLLTSLDVLTTGSYLRLPTCIKVDSPLTIDYPHSDVPVENGNTTYTVDGC